MARICYLEKMVVSQCVIHLSTFKMTESEKKHPHTHTQNVKYRSFEANTSIRNRMITGGSLTDELTILFCAGHLRFHVSEATADAAAAANSR